MTTSKACFYFLLWLTTFLGLFLNNCEARDVNFDDIFTDEPSQDEYVQKKSHFVFVTTRPLLWLEYATIKSSIVTLGVTEVNLWVPPDAQFEGRIWELVLAFPEVRVRHVEMPTSVYGNPIKVPAHASDVLRLEVMYQEGGIYQDYNAIALRSNDDLIYNNSSKPTIMATSSWGRVGNAWFMSKPHSAFLRRWMSSYTTFNDAQWAAASTIRAGNLARQFPDEVTVLNIHAWFYPVCCSADSADKLWFGKTFTDIDINYGTHQWNTQLITTRLMSPEAVRTIDTPFFCRIRHVFDGVEGGGVAVEEKRNPNCSIVGMAHLADNATGLISSYNFNTDSAIKLDDTSGNNLHGWAPFGTGLLVDNGSMVREFRENNFAVLPLPTGYDARMGMISVEMMFQPGHYIADKVMNMTRIRFDDDTSISWGITYYVKQETARLHFITNSNNGAKGITMFTSNQSFSIHDNKYHTFTLAWDRLSQGLLVALMDGEEIMRQQIPNMNKPRIGQELWLNSASQEEYDMGLRARLRYLRLYSKFTLDENITQAVEVEIKTSTGMGGVRILAQKVGFTSTFAMVSWLLVIVAGMLSLVLQLTQMVHRRISSSSDARDVRYSDVKERKRSLTEWITSIWLEKRGRSSADEQETVPLQAGGSRESSEA